MRMFLLCGAALALVGCGSQTTTFVKSDTTLGRVVVYRNGVAYFERYADVHGDSLKLNVPNDKVDDFLKSLTVVDAQTGEPAPISYPSASPGGTIDMKVELPKGATSRKLRVSYVTEAPSWKPSYRVVVGKNGKVDLQGWAIVDNTSGEDWRDVKLGVGASSAMSFRFDLKGLRLVQRETLRENDLFALAPPMGGAAYGQQPGQPARHRILADVTDEVIAANEQSQAEKKPLEAPAPTRQYGAGMGKVGGQARGHGNDGGGAYGGAVNAPMDPVQRMASSLRGSSNTIVVEGYAAPGDKDKMTASLERANKLRDQLVRNGVDPNKIVALGKGEQQGRAGGARLVEAPVDDRKGDETKTAASITPANANAATPVPAQTEPIGTSHFESGSAMTVAKGSSAMVSILRGETEGEVVYLYDPESARGNAQFPFRTLRFRNPTDGALESGPVSVFGEGRFVGEGLAEPIPARQVAFVPFALDRQVVVERKDAEHDEIARIITITRGVFSTEVQHTKKASFTLYNRMNERVAVYLRHTVPQGYKLTKTPDSSGLGTTKSDTPEHIAGAHLFRVELEPNAKTDVTIEEATPVFRTTDIRTPAGLEMVRVFLTKTAGDSPLRPQIEKLLALNTDMAKIEQHIATTREQMAEYRTRMDEIHNQIFTLKAVKTAGPLMTHLEKKLQEISEKLSKSTVDVVTLQEKLMVARVQFQTGVGDLTLETKDTREAVK